MPKYSDQEVNQLLSDEDAIQHEDGSIRWSLNNSKGKKPGTYIRRPPNAAPLINKETATEFQRKRWEPYQNMEAFERWVYRQHNYPMHMRVPKEGYIYFIQADTEPCCIKIGQSINLTNRFNQLNTNSPVRLKMLAAVYVPSTNEFETLFHEYFAEKRVKGEWFDIEPRDVYELLNKFWRQTDF